MKTFARILAISLLAFNAGLVILTLALSLQAQFQNPMQGELVELDGANIHVIENTTGGYDAPAEAAFDALVLIHGASTSALDFTNNLLPELSKHFPVVAIDRPGHGYSDRGSRPDTDSPMQQADIILDTLAVMGIENPVLIGHSWAGSVVLAALLAEHDSVKPAAGVVVAGVSHPYAREDSLPTRLALAPILGPIFRWQYLSPVGRLAMPSTVERFFYPDTVPANYIRDTGLILSLRPDPYLFNARDRSNLSDHLILQAKLYARIKRPLLSIAASEDHVVPPADHHRKLIDAVRDAQAVLISGAGHSPHHTRTDEVVQAIKHFIESRVI